MLFLHPALAQTRDYSRSNYTCKHFLIYDTPVHTWNKWSSERARKKTREWSDTTTHWLHSPDHHTLTAFPRPPHTDCIPQTTTHWLHSPDNHTLTAFPRPPHTDCIPQTTTHWLHSPDHHTLTAFPRQPSTFFQSVMSFRRLKRKIPFPWDLAMGFMIQMKPGLRRYSSTKMWYSDWWKETRQKH